MNDLTSRAFAAYFRGQRRYDYIIDQPASYPESGPSKVGDKDYVVLRNCNGILAVYRVRTTGALKRLWRWPEGLV